MDGLAFIQAFDGTRPITFGDPIEAGELRLSVIKESTVTRVAVKESQANRIQAFAELLGGNVCWNGDLITVVLPPNTK
ncbi:MAG: hypothetical protein RL417_2623 [Pseudomonadota bacterium]|jgi:hypothetical protein